jgi:uncharacterized protein (DUF1697 family)
MLPMRCVALLRGIGPMNPAMRNEHLRRVVEGLGYGDVRTVISSGNVVFDAPAGDAAALEAELEAAWPRELGFTSTTIVRTRDQIDAMIAADPFDGRDDTKAASQQVTFLKLEPEEPLVPFASELGDFEVIAVRDRAIYSVIDETGKPPGLLRVLERQLGKAMTTRSWKSVHRIAKAMELS